MNHRRLTVEPMDERFGKPVAKAKLRLKGRWLKAAGFEPGEQVEVVLERPGQLTIRSFRPVPADGGQRTLNEQPELNLDPCP